MIKQRYAQSKAKRQEYLPFAQPDFDQTELDQVKEALDSGWITTGPKVHQFEQAFAAAVGAKHAVAVNSCTAAMHLALEAIGLEAGDEVVTTPYTFAATAEVVRYFNARPVFVDVDPDSLNIRSELIEAAITARTKAIVPVHFAGLPAELDEIYAIAARHHLAVVEDAAHAFPTKYKGHFVGASSPLVYKGPAAKNGAGIQGSSFADQGLSPDVKVSAPPSNPEWQPPSFVCFSFYATKSITTGEGGMICTADDALAQRCRIMALHGISKDAWKRYTAAGSWYYEIIAPGYKYNLTDVAAAIGLAQLQKAERMWQRRCEIARRYSAEFACWPELQIPADRPDCQHAWHLYPLRLNLNRLGLDRAQFIEALKQLNIGASVHFIPLHLHPYYREIYGYVPADFLVAYQEYQRLVSLPIYSKMSDSDIDDVIQAVLQVVHQWRKH